MKVAGFRAAAVAAGMRYQNRLDLGLIAADEPVAAAGVFTRNLVKAAPVLWSRDKLASGLARAILVNAGRANACTGPEGMAVATASAEATARSLGCGSDDVLLASTGVIGEQLNLAALEKAVPDLVGKLGEDQLELVAQAMMTTDTRPKIIEANGQIDAAPFTIVGMAKGAGMMQPNMATMLSFILTDAAVTPDHLTRLLRRGVEMTFNRVTVDGDTSTNDTVLALASAKAGNAALENDRSPGSEDFEKAFTGVMADLARMLAADGEGATKLVRVSVTGAVDEGQAKAAAFTVANSPLVKTALFGQDANWGRIMMALGRSGAQFDPDQVIISLDDVPFVLGGRAAGAAQAADEVMRLPEFTMHIDLGAGRGKAEVITCDLSVDYVKINADYRS